MNQAKEKTLEMLELDAEAIASRLATIGLSQSDRETLRKFWPHAEDITRPLLNDFYKRFVDTPELAAILGSPERTKKLVDVQELYLKSLFCDAIDGGYVAKRLTIGVRHHELHVTPQ